MKTPKEIPGIPVVFTKLSLTDSRSRPSVTGTFKAKSDIGSFMKHRGIEGKKSSALAVVECIPFAIAKPELKTQQSQICMDTARP